MSREMDLAFGDMYMISSRPKYRTRPGFNFFGCSNDFKTQKVCFLRLMRVYVDLIRLSAGI